jgi:hypothetical protein
MVTVMLRAEGGTVRVRSVVSAGRATVILAREAGSVTVTSLVRLDRELGELLAVAGDSCGDMITCFPSCRVTNNIGK